MENARQGDYPALNTVPALRALNIGDLTVMKHNLHWPPPNYEPPKVETHEQVFKALLIMWANKQVPHARTSVAGYWLKRYEAAE